MIEVAPVSPDFRLVFPTSRGRKREEELMEFSRVFTRIAEKIGFKLSPRGWCYELESIRLVDKDLFDKAEEVINEGRIAGFISVDLVADEDARHSEGVEVPNRYTPAEYISDSLDFILDAGEYYTPNWWKDEDYYVQILVEKVDLKTLFKPVAKAFHIPIMSGKGWSSILQRAEFARRFKQAEDDGLTPVLLYFGDFDPDGERISDFLTENFNRVKKVVWKDGAEGWDPKNLVIDRFGLNRDFIEEFGLTWVDNLHTGAKSKCKKCGGPMRLDDLHHPNNGLPYVQKWLKTIGVRKCEANAVLRADRPEIIDRTRDLCRKAILKYLGEDAEERFERRRQEVRDKFNELDEKTGLKEAIRKVRELIE